MRRVAVLGAAAGARRSPCISRASATTCGCGRAIAALVDDMRARRANAVYLPDVALPDT